MKDLNQEQRSALETRTRLLRERERSLQYLAQSRRCSSRSEAELELERVREQLAGAYAQLRRVHPDGSAGPRYPRG